MSRRLLALLGAPLLLVAFAGQAAATIPPGQVTVDTDGCSFTVHIAFQDPQAVIAWKVKVYDANNWKDGETLIKDSVSGDADGKVDAGPYTLPEGHYNVAVDNEASIDGSALVQDFTLSCPASTETATPTPTGTEEPITGTPTPTATGTEEAATGTPGGGGGGVNRTPPPTDTGMASTTGGNSGLPLIALSLLGIAGTLVWYTRRTLATARARRRR
jgi:hypothetical protein